MFITALPRRGQELGEVSEDPSHDEMEAAMGYTLINFPDLRYQHYYANFDPVCPDLSARTVYEYRIWKKMRSHRQGRVYKRLAVYDDRLKERTRGITAADFNTTSV